MAGGLNQTSCFPPLLINGPIIWPSHDRVPRRIVRATARIPFGPGYEYNFLQLTAHQPAQIFAPVLVSTADLLPLWRSEMHRHMQQSFVYCFPGTMQTVHVGVFVGLRCILSPRLSAAVMRKAAPPPAAHYPYLACKYSAGLLHPAECSPF